MNTPCTTFSAPLLRLILCGGGGLPPAWGPIQGGEFGPWWAWDPSRGVAVISGPDEIRSGYHPVIEAPETWHFPMDPSSPWPARLELVAAYLTWLWTSPTVLINPPKFDMLAASVDRAYYDWEKGDVIALTRFAHRGPIPSVYTWKWSIETGRCWDNAPRLPTLPTHLALHPPVVAILLSLYDVPEIRARVEAL